MPVGWTGGSLYHILGSRHGIKFKFTSKISLELIMARSINQVKLVVYFADRGLILMMLTKNEKNVIFQQGSLMILGITHREVAIFIIISRPTNSQGLSI